MADKQATWKLQIDADGKKAAAAAADLERLKGQIRASKDAIDNYRIALRSLKGTTDEVKTARDALKGKIEQEQNALNRANIGIRRAQSAFELYSKKAKDAGAATDGMRKAASAVGGPIGAAVEKVSSWKDVLGGVSPASALAVAGLGILALAFVALTATMVAGTFALARFTLESANALRAQGLMREAVTEGAADAARYGHQIDALAAKLPTSRDKLNELAVSVRGAFNGTKLSGQGIVDTVEAVASASAAAGDEVGRTLQGILDRGKRFGRVGINPFELQGTAAPQFDAIAASLAKKMHVGVAKASMALRMGLVPIDAAAAAIKDAVNERFGQVNAKKMLDLDVIMAKFHENLAGLTSGVNLEPFAAALRSVTDLFSQNTVTGQALKQVFTAIGNGLGQLATALAPSVTAALQHTINTALRLGIVFLDLATVAVKWARSDEGIATLKATLITIGVIAGALVAVFAALGAVVVASAAPIYYVVRAVMSLAEVWKRLKAIDWSAIGRSILEGIANGLASARTWLIGKVTAVADGIKDTFKDALGIHSPSAVFAEYGRQTGEGYAGGVEASAPGANTAVSRMVAPPPRSPATAGGASSAAGTTIHVENHYHFGAGVSPERAQALMTAPSVLDGLTHALERALRAAGVPTQTPAVA